MWSSFGSGAGGGTVAHVLTALGVRVTLLEAGPMLDPFREFKEHQWPYDVDHRVPKKAANDTLAAGNLSAISPRRAVAGSWPASHTRSAAAVSSSGSGLGSSAVAPTTTVG